MHELLYIHAATLSYLVSELDLSALFDAIRFKLVAVDERMRRRKTSRHHMPLMIQNDKRVYFSRKHIYSAWKISATQLSLYLSGCLSFGFTGPGGERRLRDILEALADEFGLRLHYDEWKLAGVTYCEVMVCLGAATAQIIARNFGRQIDKRLILPNRSYLLAVPIVFAISGVGVVPAELCIYQLAPHLNQTPDYFKLEVRPLDRHTVRKNPAALIRTLPTNSPHAWLLVSHAFARWIGKISDGLDLVPVPPVWKSTPLPMEGPVPLLQGHLIGANNALHDESLLVPELVADLRFNVVAGEEFYNWSLDQRRRWIQGDLNDA